MLLLLALGFSSGIIISLMIIFIINVIKENTLKKLNQLKQTENSVKNLISLGIEPSIYDSLKSDVLNPNKDNKEIVEESYRKIKEEKLKKIEHDKLKIKKYIEIINDAIKNRKFILESECNGIVTSKNSIHIQSDAYIINIFDQINDESIKKSIEVLFKDKGWNCKIINRFFLVDTRNVDG